MRLSLPRLRDAVARRVGQKLPKIGDNAEIMISMPRTPPIMFIAALRLHGYTRDA